MASGSVCCVYILLVPPTFVLAAAVTEASHSRPYKEGNNQPKTTSLSNGSLTQELLQRNRSTKQAAKFSVRLIHIIASLVSHKHERKYLTKPFEMADLAPKRALYLRREVSRRFFLDDRRKQNGSEAVRFVSCYDTNAGTLVEAINANVICSRGQKRPL